MESWDLQYGRLIYSIFILLLQLILPSLILILAHASIYRKLVSSRFLLRRSLKKILQIIDVMETFSLKSWYLIQKYLR